MNNAALFLEWVQIIVVYDYDQIPEEMIYNFHGVVFAPSFHIQGKPFQNVIPVKVIGETGLSCDITQGLYSNSGGAGLAISLAWAMGAEKILLCGYDYNQDRLDHWYKREDSRAYALENCRLGMERITTDTGNRIINCSENSSLTRFPFGSLEVELGAIN